MKDWTTIILWFTIITDLGHLGLELSTGQVGLARVHHFEDELLAAQERVADELAFPNGNGCISHV
jgi:hypothetical protein